MMKNVIVLVMHGMSPLDFPPHEKQEFMRLHAQLNSNPNGLSAEQRARHDAIDAKMRSWPRTGKNDPFYASSCELAAELERSTGLKVILGFHEFCTPSTGEALDEAAQIDGSRVFVITPMVTRGGVHSEVEIPAMVAQARSKYPNREFVYAWPFESEDIARFLSSQLNRFLLSQTSAAKL